MMRIKPLTSKVIEEYKKIFIGFFDENHWRILQNLFSYYPKFDLFLLPEDDKIFLYIKQIDLLDLKERIQYFSKKFPMYTHIFNNILHSIETIKSYGLKGRKRILVGYDKERKVKDRKKKEIERGKYYYARDHNFSRKNSELPLEFKNRIIVGDSEEILKKLPDNCIDLIFTSPPYNFGLEYENHKDGISWNNYFKKLFAIFEECIRVLKYGGRIIIDIQPLFSDYVPLHHIVSNFFIQRKLIWKGEIIWDKHNYSCKYTAWGSWKSPSNPYIKYTWEFLEIFSKGTLTHYGNRKLTDIAADEFKKWVFAKWDIAPEYNMKKYGHPAMFPEELATRVIKLFTYKGDVVLDPFNGVGTTTVVANRLGRIYLGIDISEEYCKKAEERIAKEGKRLF